MSWPPRGLDMLLPEEVAQLPDGAVVAVELDHLGRPTVRMRDDVDQVEAARALIAVAEWLLADAAAQAAGAAPPEAAN